MIETIELDWYKDYDIKVTPSKKSGEAYSTVGDFKIDNDWNGAKELKDNYKALYHKSFGFLLFDPEWVDVVTMKRCFENIEKLYLLYKLGAQILFHWAKIVKPEDATFSTVSGEFVEDIAALTLDEQLKKETKGKEIYCFKRAEWKVNKREPFFSGDVTTRIGTRFNFLVLDKT